ncbi:MAG: hypothetical protein QM534_13975 [Sediminibacterium sp.]|nr:hypothetical protein [Sediminibacterium sp.]
MLKNKKAIYVLIPLNLFIWGYLAYSIYDGLKGEDTEVAMSEPSGAVVKAEEDSVVYKLKLTYPDPFLKDVPREREVKLPASDGQAAKPLNKPLAVPVVKTNTVAPKPPADIRYLGLVKNSTTGIATALISVDGKTYVIKKGDVIETFSIKEVHSDYVELKEGKTVMKINK